MLSRIKFHNGRFSFLGSFPSAAAHKFKFSLLQLSPFSSNCPKPMSENSNQDSFPAIYLKIRCGFSPEKALMYSKYMRFDSSERPDSVIAFFKNHHFSDAQISVIVRKWPYVFRYIPESSFRPKIEFLHSLGLSSSDIVRILTLAPELLKRSLEAQTIPCVDLLRSFLCSDKDVMFSIMRFPHIIVQNLQKTVLPNIEILRATGVPESHIAALLKNSTRSIASSPDSFRVIVQEVHKLGLNPQKKVFLKGVVVMGQLSSSTWKEKINLYKRWGWSENQVLDAFRKHPCLMAVSQDKINRIMDLFANKMGGDCSLVMRRPQIFSLSFEKTIAPRCTLYQVLLSKGLIKQGFSLSRMLDCPQRLFLARYVQCYVEEAPELFEMYKETLSPLEE